MSSLESRSGRSAFFENIVGRLIPAIVFIVLVLTLWEITARLTGVSSIVLPRPSDIWSSLIQLSGLLAANIGITLLEIVIGYIVAVAAGIGVAFAIRSAKIIDRSVHPWLVTLQTVPMPAIAPIFVVWTGFDIRSKILVIAFGSFFPIAINAVDGLRAVDPRMLDLLKTLGASGFQRFLYAKLPAALPHIFSGMRVAAAFAVVSAVFAEWVGSNAGLGYLLLRLNNQLKTPEMFAVIAVLAAIGMAFFGLLTLIERLSIPWYFEERRKKG